MVCMVRALRGGVAGVVGGMVGNVDVMGPAVSVLAAMAWHVDPLSLNERRPTRR